MARANSVLADLGLAFLLAGVVCCVGCGRDGAPGAVDISTAKPGELTEAQMRDLPDAKRFVYESDHYARIDLASTEWESAEAREWLSGERHTGGEASKKDLVEMTEAFYEAGAAKVYVTGIAVFKPEDWGVKPANEEEAKGVAVSDTLIVELPDDPVKRKAVIDLAVKYFAETWEETYDSQDYGQKYIRFVFG